MRVRARNRTREDGFTLVEVAVASALLLIAILGVVTIAEVAARNTADNRAREGGTSLARQLVENTRAIPFDQLTNQQLEARLQERPGLASVGSGSTYTIRRRGFTYSINASTCALDDPRDGIGSHQGDYFCRGPASGLGDTPEQCQGLIAAQGDGTVDANGNKLDLSLCATLDGTLVWQVCSLLGTTAQAQASGSLAAILGSLYTEAQTAASATTCGSGGAVAADADPVDYKRVTVTVRWKGKRTQQTTLIANPGRAGGPTVTNLQLTSNGGNVNVTTNLTSLAFRATVNRPPATVPWTVDGDLKGTAGGSGLIWTFSWDIKDRDALDAVVDGAYLVGARAKDATGLSGPGRTLTVNLNRRVPRAPTGLAGGRTLGGSSGVVDLEWRPNPERDIVGYRVYRRPLLGPPVQVCPETGTHVVRTSCQDTSAPSGIALTYFVRALDRDPNGNLREGDTSLDLAVSSLNTRPNPPTNLLAAKSGTRTILAWQAASDPDPGDSIAFYRIYRDGSSYADRYDRTDTGSNLSYVDNRADGVPHTYYVTAVDQNFGESTLLGPVTK